MSQPPSSSAEIGSHTGKCCGQSQYREAPRWKIFMEQELRFGQDLGRMVPKPFDL